MRVCYLSLSAISLLACGDDGGKTPDAPPMPDADYRIGEHPQLARACTDTLADVYTLPTDLPAMDDSHRGDVFRCALAEKLTIPEVQTQIDEYNKNYPKATPAVVESGFWTYRLAFRTTRITKSNVRDEGDTAATLIIPAKPLAGAPLVVAGHGSVGFASKCAPSLLDLSGAVQDQDYPPLLYRLAAYGYTVIAPDYAGFSYGQTPGYFNAEDEAHAILDATRAAAKLLPTPPAKVVFVGFSQGGHTVLAAHSYAKSYGMQGELVGVAAMAPLWMSMSLWGAATTSTGGLNTTDNTNTVLYAMAYAYSAGELRDGTGDSVFDTAKQAAAVEVINGGECYDKAKMMALGATPADFFLPAYVSEVGNACAISGSCSTTLSTKWQTWWKEDRPPIDAMGAPILAMFGGGDMTVTLARAGCAKKKIDADIAAVSGATTSVSYCMTENYDHRDMPRGPAPGYINEWIAARGGVGAEPAACTPLGTPNCSLIPVDH
jgi:pimeloyl-ACP methyl ester carboxylesterase